MHDHALWYVRRGGHVVGPFAEPLVCRYIALGRIQSDDELSLDGHYWRHQEEFPELMLTVRQLLGLGHEVMVDPVWREERIKASLRWLDERVSLDRRSRETPAQAAEWAARRQLVDRRSQPETVEQHVYRQSYTAFDNWLRSQRYHYSRGVKVVAVLLALAVFAVFFYRPMNPVRVGLFIPSIECDIPANSGVNWVGCDKSGMLLVGVDVSGADLRRANFSGANLSYSNFSQANMAEADLRNADLRHVNMRGAQLLKADLRGAKVDGADFFGAELGGAVWADGRTCKMDSQSKCN